MTDFYQVEPVGAGHGAVGDVSGAGEFVRSAGDPLTAYEGESVESTDFYIAEPYSEVGFGEGFFGDDDVEFGRGFGDPPVTGYTTYDTD